MPRKTAAFWSVLVGIPLAGPPALAIQADGSPETAPPTQEAEQQEIPEPRPDRGFVISTVPEPPPVLAEATEADGSLRAITEIRLRYLREVEGQPTRQELLAFPLRLSKTEEGWLPPRRPATIWDVPLADLAAAETTSFYDSALPLISEAVVSRFGDLGYLGVYVEPDPNQFRVEGGRVIDGRAEGDTSLTLIVTMGVIADVRSIAQGKRHAEGDTININAHERIRNGSPVAPANEAQDSDGQDTETTDDRPALIRRDLIDRYVHHLNRHPARQVDVAVVPTGSAFGGVTVDYLVTEDKPWILYAQLGNTGSKSTEELQERFGFIHYQLTNADDILSVNYLTGGFDEVNALSASYDRPLTDDGRLRGRVYGSWYEYTAADIGQTNLDFDGDGYTIGLESRWNIHQDEDFFVDLVGGLRFESTSVDNELAAVKGEEEFLIPSLGLRAERYRKTDRFNAGLTYEISALSGDDQELTALGRVNTDDTWSAVKYDASYSFYLEPLLADNPNEPTPLAHELVFTSRGQWAFDNRLPPNFQQVAGGLFTVRGYCEALTAGDSVLLAGAEYRYHIPQGLAPQAQTESLAGSPFRVAPQYVSGPTDWDLILKGFIDVGRVLNSEAQTFETDATLLGSGFGVEGVLGRNLRAQVDFAWALLDVEDAAGSNQADSGDFEVHFLVTLIY